MIATDRWEPSSMARDLVDFALRPVCLLCRDPLRTAPPFPMTIGEGRICPSCAGRIETLPEPLCDRCGTPLPARRTDGCPTCRRSASGPAPTRSAAPMTGMAGTLVHLLKYRGWPALAETLALEIVSASWSTAEFWSVDRLVPVPLSRVRRRERGYNQSERLAAALSELVGVPSAPELLRRARWRRPQVGQPLEVRRANVRGAFAIGEGEARRIEGRRLMIVDDVITTGATVRACFDALRGAGAAAVSCVSFGRAESTRDF